MVAQVYLLKARQAGILRVLVGNTDMEVRLAQNEASDGILEERLEGGQLLGVE